MTKAQLLAVGLTAGLAGGRAAHEQWERTRGEENECDAEKRLHEEVSGSVNTIPIHRRGRHAGRQHPHRAPDGTRRRAAAEVGALLDPASHRSSSAAPRSGVGLKELLGRAPR